MSEESIMKHLNEMVATVELSVQDWNVLVNVLNMPQQAQTIILKKYLQENLKENMIHFMERLVELN